MRPALREQIVAVCAAQIASKGAQVGLSFCAFFATKSADPALLVEAVTGWIQVHRLDHFETAVKIRRLALGMEAIHGV